MKAFIAAAVLEVLAGLVVALSAPSAARADSGAPGRCLSYTGGDCRVLDRAVRIEDGMSQVRDQGLTAVVARHNALWDLARSAPRDGAAPAPGPAPGCVAGDKSSDCNPPAPDTEEVVKKLDAQTTPPPAAQHENVTPWQKEVDLAGKLLTWGGLILGIAAALIQIGQKMGHLGLHIVMMGRMLCYAAAGLGAIAAFLGLMTLFHGQVLQSALLIFGGVGLVFAALKTAKHGKNAYKDLQEELDAQQKGFTKRLADWNGHHVYSTGDGAKRLIQEDGKWKVIDGDGNLIGKPVDRIKDLQIPKPTTNVRSPKPLEPMPPKVDLKLGDLKAGDPPVTPSENLDYGSPSMSQPLQASTPPAARLTLPTLTAPPARTDQISQTELPANFGDSSLLKLKPEQPLLPLPGPTYQQDSGPLPPAATVEIQLRNGDTLGVPEGSKIFASDLMQNTSYIVDRNGNLLAQVATDQLPDSLLQRDQPDPMLGAGGVPNGSPIEGGWTPAGGSAGKFGAPRYGPKGYYGHSGQDIKADYIPVQSTQEGTVYYVGPDGREGNVVKIVNGNYMTVYAHLDSWEVQPGQQVYLGQEIGVSGNTGHTFGPHLHYEVRTYKNGHWITVNPVPYLNGTGR